MAQTRNPDHNSREKRPLCFLMTQTRHLVQFECPVLRLKDLSHCPQGKSLIATAWNDNEASDKLTEARKMIEFLDSRGLSFIQRECDEDILRSFHLDVFIFGLFALEELSSSRGGVGEDELQLLDSLVGEHFGLKVYKQLMDMTDIWAGYEEGIPYSLSVLAEYSARDELEENCNDYINLHGNLHYCLCTAFGFDDLRVAKKIMKMSLYCMSQGA